MNSILFTRLLCWFFVFLSSLFFLTTLHNTHAQSVSTGWYLQGYIWNERLDVWARTTCNLAVGGVGGVARVSACSKDNNAGSFPCNLDSCRGTTGSNHGVRYYHDGDAAGNIQDGELRGTAWSPLGTISFDEEHFPAEDCYGLEGKARQARIVRVNHGDDKKVDINDAISNPGVTAQTTISLVGCAYVPILKDYILLSPVGATGIKTVNSISDWTGVYPEADSEAGTGECAESVEHCVGVNRPHIKVFGCGWSEKNGFWSFGPNPQAVTSSNCLPSSHETELGKVLDTPSLGYRGNQLEQLCSFLPEKRSGRIGESIRFSASCPFGFSAVQDARFMYFNGDIGSVKDLLEGSTAVPKSGSVFSYSFFNPLFLTIRGLNLSCVDQHEHNIFGSLEEACFGQESSVSVEAVSLNSFKLNPSVIVEGGLVTFDATIDNFADPNISNTFCKITNRFTDEVASCFKAGFLTTNTTTESNLTAQPFFNRKDLVVRDVVYDLECWYQQNQGSDQDNSLSTTNEEFCSDPSIADRSEWSRVGPISAAARILPNRTIERNVLSTIPVPSVSLGEGQNKDKILIDVEEKYYSSATDNPSSVMVYIINDENPFVMSDKPNYTLFFFKDIPSATSHVEKLTGSSINCEGRPVTTQCLNDQLNVERVIIGSPEDGALEKSDIASNSKLVAELYVGSGGRSQKVVFDLKEQREQREQALREQALREQREQAPQAPQEQTRQEQTRRELEEQAQEQARRELEEQAQQALWEQEQARYEQAQQEWEQAQEQ